MNDLTKKQKIDALMKSMTGISFREACALLGFDENDPDLVDDSTLGRIKDMLGL
jgi:uncharacterized ParB-like nuclease family protein